MRLVAASSVLTGAFADGRGGEHRTQVSEECFPGTAALCEEFRQSPDELLRRAVLSLGYRGA